MSISSSLLFRIGYQTIETFILVAHRDIDREKRGLMRVCVCVCVCLCVHNRILSGAAKLCSINSGESVAKPRPS